MLTTWPCHGRVTPPGASTSSSSFWKIPQPSSPSVSLPGSRAGATKVLTKVLQLVLLICEQTRLHHQRSINWWPLWELMNVFSLFFFKVHWLQLLVSIVAPLISQVTKGPWSHVKDHRIMTGRSPSFTRRWFLCRGWSADWSIMKIIGYHLLIIKLATSRAVCQIAFEF